MKTLSIILLSASVLQCIYSLDRADLRRQFVKDKKVCFHTYRLSHNVISKMANLELVDDDTLKKYVFCLGRRRHYINVNGTYNLHRIEQSYAAYSGSYKKNIVFEKCTKTPIIGDAVASYWKLIRCFQLMVPIKGFNKMMLFYWLPHYSAHLT